MTKPISRELSEPLSQFGQEDLVAFWDRLDAAKQQQLEQQIRALDLVELNDLFQQATKAEEEDIDWTSVCPAPAYRLQDHSTNSAAMAYQLGVEALRTNQVGVVLVAGGQGSRLGFEQPKGLFPIGPVSQRCLLQVLIDRIRAISNRYESSIPLYLMTSPQTKCPLEDFLEKHRPGEMEGTQIKLFCQQAIPAVDRRTGKILMESTDSIALSPNGHGGMLAAFAEQGCLADAEQRSLKYLFYGQIDNPLLPICDPQLIGYHILAQSEMSTHVVAKTAASEKVGVALLRDDQFQILEYSQLPETVATRNDPDGNLLFWAGSIGSHVFSTSLLRQAADDTSLLPYHASKKNVPCVQPDGTPVNPTTLNAFKFERFIFDLATAATNPVLVEVDRQEAFAPVKNADGAERDTPMTARQMMSDLYRSWLVAASIQVAPDVDIEINPCWALDQEEFAAKTTDQTSIDKPTYFHP